MAAIRRRVLRRRPEIAVKHEFAAAHAHAQLVFIRVEQLYPVTRAFREREAMPGLLHRPVFSGLAFAAPAGDFELRAPRIEAWSERAIFDLHRRAALAQLRISMRSTRPSFRRDRASCRETGRSIRRYSNQRLDGLDQLRHVDRIGKGRSFDAGACSPATSSDWRWNRTTCSSPSMAQKCEDHGSC